MFKPLLYLDQYLPLESKAQQRFTVTVVHSVSQSVSQSVTHSLTHSLTHFLMYCPGYDNIRNELHSLLSTHDAVFKSLNAEGKILYLLTLENETTSKIVGKYTYLMFQKRKDILNAK